MIKTLLLSIILSCIYLSSFSQNQEQKIVQFSGVIYDTDSNTVVPYVNLRNSTSGKYYSANYKGYYSFVAHEGDTIHFTSVGYKKTSLIIPKGLKDKKFTAIVKLKADNIMLPVVRVFPWVSTDEFKKEFLTMKFADDDLEIAKKNLSKKTLRDLSYSLARDGGEIQGMSFNNNHIGLSNKNMVQTNPLLNPLAWAALIKQISEGDKNRNKD